jgi:hypothetical protein
MNTKEIVEAWLRANGYDGLYSDWCVCKLDDLFPCGEVQDCNAGYFTDCPDPGGCECEGQGFHIGGRLGVG